MSRAMYAVPREHTPLPAPGSKPRSNIPSPATSLVGREYLIADACTALRNPDIHWITMSGPPGVGKTRLALRVADLMCASLTDGVYFVPLASVTDPQRVLSSIAQSLGLKEIGHRSLADRLKRYLRNRHILLLLDNLEQVTQAAGSISELQEVCAGLKVLATSRTLLHMYGEHDFPVPPLLLPDPVSSDKPDIEGLLQSESVALFVQRAQAARPDFQLTGANAAAVVDICVHLEGLPLAIELAAARMRLLPAQAILSRVAHRLRFLQGGALNLPPRQRTLRGAVEWSYDLLAPEEQHLFRHLAVFVGGGTLEAIVGCAAHNPDSAGNDASWQDGGEKSEKEEASESNNEHTLELVSSLIDKSLLRQVDGVSGEPRYVMLETVREYALERLLASGEADFVRQCHAVYYTELAEGAYAELQGSQQAFWLDLLEEEHDNFRAALEWACSCGEYIVKRPAHAENGTHPGTAADDVQVDAGSVAMRLASALHPFWEMRGYMSEGRARLVAALHSTGSRVVSEARAQALFAAGRMALIQRDDAAAAPFLEESLALHKQLRHKLGTSCALVSLGHLAIRHGDYRKAEELYQEAFIIRTELGDNLWIARSLAGLAYLAHYRGDDARAAVLHEQCLALAREAGDKSAMGDALVYLSYLLACQGQYSRAQLLLAEGMELFKELGSSHGIADCLAIYGKVADAQANGESAVLLFSLAKSLFDATGTRMEPPSHSDLGEYERTVEHLRTMLGSESFTRLWEKAQTMTPEQVIEHAQHPASVAVPTIPADLSPVPTWQSHSHSAFPAGLTAREVEVLRLVASGLTNIEAAERLTVSRHTINMHLRSIYTKLEVSSRTAATRVAIAEGLV
ncbi:MAG: LuxR C-terminal-related transcriptional regulator [Chloroflexota bacterium]